MNRVTVRISSTNGGTMQRPRIAARSSGVVVRVTHRIDLTRRRSACTIVWANHVCCHVYLIICLINNQFHPFQTRYPRICKQPPKIRRWRRRPWRRHSGRPWAPKFHATSRCRVTCGDPSWRSKRRATKRRFCLRRTTRSSRWTAIWSRRFSWGESAAINLGYLLVFV